MKNPRKSSESEGGNLTNFPHGTKKLNYHLLTSQINNFKMFKNLVSSIHLIYILVR